MSTYKITGSDAVRLAQRENLTVCDRDGIPFVTVTPTGWRNAQGNHCDGEGRTVESYFSNGEYLGPDDDGVEPCWSESGITRNAINSYLSTLSSDARADWSAGRVDEVMSDHAESHFGAPITRDIVTIARAL
jgi:hypothetical protein